MEFTAGQIAALVGGTVEGDSEVKVNTFAKIEEAGPGSLTFLANPKYIHYIYTTNAGAVLVGKDMKLEGVTPSSLIRVDNPYEALSRLMRMVDAILNPQPTGVEQPSFVAPGVAVSDDCYIGAFAYIGEGAKLGTGVKVYPHVFVGCGAEIGDNTILYPGVRVYPRCKVGSRCILHAGVTVGADGFGFAPNDKGEYEKIPQMGIAVICDDVEIGANTTVDRATMGTTVIGRGTKLDNLIQVAHNCTVGEHTVIAAQAGIAGSTHVGSHCAIGGQVGFAGHITVGDNVQIGAQSGVPNNVADGSRIMGYPAVGARDFMRQAAAIRRLPHALEELRELKAAIGALGVPVTGDARI